MRKIFSLILLLYFLVNLAQEPQRQDDMEIKNLLLGKFNPASHPDFIKIDSRYTTKKHAYMQKEAFDAFVHMYDSARSDGVELVIVSATRTFFEQKQIWENKWSGKTLVGGMNLAKTIINPNERARLILQYSSMPGTSRHHWGTDIDLNSVDTSYFKTPEGEKVYKWLKDHAAFFGFCQPYVEWGSDRLTGYQPEPWHWSYMPLASSFLSRYEELISYEDLTGFSGSETAKEIQVIENYVFGINRQCLLWKQ